MGFFSEMLGLAKPKSGKLSFQVNAESEQVYEYLRKCLDSYNALGTLKKEQWGFSSHQRYVKDIHNPAQILLTVECKKEKGVVANRSFSTITVNGVTSINLMITDLVSSDKEINKYLESIKADILNHFSK